MLQRRATGRAILPLFSILAFLNAGPVTPGFAATTGIILVDDSSAGTATPPIPLPTDAASVNYDAEAGSLEFESPTSVKELADFYRDAMKKLGWVVQPSVINNDNMVELQFAKGGDELSFTLMRMGDQTQFTGEGQALAGKAAADSSAPADSSADTQAKPVDAGADVQLTAEDKDGFPIPSDHSAAGSESTMFRRSVDVTVSASVSAVVAFYRAELAKKGWKEQADKANVKDNAADLIFDSSDGPVKLKINRDNDLTTATLSIRDQAKASKSPLFPKPGQIKVMLGDITGNAADVVIGGKHVKVAANAGSKGPDGPTIDLAPGKIEVAIKGAGNDSFQAGPDEIWMVMIGPGGILSVQAY